MPTWLLWLTAVLVGGVIWMIGTAMLRSLSPKPGQERAEGVEDVDELEVYLVCGECGTELKVSRLGELEVPRHCGGRMQVVRHPPA